MIPKKETFPLSLRYPPEAHCPSERHRSRSHCPPKGIVSERHRFRRHRPPKASFPKRLVPPEERPNLRVDPLFPTKVRISREGKKRSFKPWKENSKPDNFVCNQRFIPFPLLLQSNDKRRRARERKSRKAKEPKSKKARDRKSKKAKEPKSRLNPQQPRPSTPSKPSRIGTNSIL